MQIADCRPPQTRPDCGAFFSILTSGPRAQAPSFLPPSAYPRLAPSTPTPTPTSTAAGLRQPTPVFSRAPQVSPTRKGFSIVHQPTNPGQITIASRSHPTLPGSLGSTEKITTGNKQEKKESPRYLPIPTRRFSCPALFPSFFKPLVDHLPPSSSTYYFLLSHLPPPTSTSTSP